MSRRRTDLPTMDAFVSQPSQPLDDGRIPPGIQADAEMAAPCEEDSGSLAVELRAPTISRAYQCQCGRPVYLRNSQCLACGTHLGYVTERLGVVPLETANGDGSDPYKYVVHGDVGGRTWRRCANFDTASRCNWMVPTPRDGEEGELTGHGLLDGFCLSCSATRTIPDQSVEANGVLWNKLELAKRRLMSQLLVLGLPIVTRHADPVGGLAFDFLSDLPGGPRILTGHENGLITLNAAEAEDVVREQIRAEMREPYRTLVGHFRHEIGHYYWDRLVYPTRWLDDFRLLFGDERDSYADALRVHYEQGPRPDWADRCVTSYASAHPWLPIRNSLSAEMPSAESKKSKPQLSSQELTIHVHKLIHKVQFKKRAPRAVKEIKKIAARRFGTSDVRIDVKLNKHLFSKGIKSVPVRVRVKLQRKRNEDEDAKERFYTLVSHVPVPTFTGLQTINSAE